MLWQKHVVNGSLVYVDLFKKEIKSVSNEFSQKLETFEEQKGLLIKNNTFSQEIRLEGNDSFQNGDYEMAINAYNRALTLAEADTEAMGICFANRSACFFDLKQYKRCVADIELAIENKCPERLMSKLNQRKENSLKCLENQTDEMELCHEKPKLSFEPHPQYPCFANELEVDLLKEVGSNITANVDLEIGQTICIEKAMIFAPMGGKDMGYCHYCFERNVNLIPCENCIIGMFCSPDCYNADNNYHRIVCCTEHFFDSGIPYELLRSIIFAINTFSTVENLMQSIEDFRKSAKGVNDYSDPAKRQYFQFFGLRSNVHRMSNEEKIQIKKYAVEVAMFMKHASKLKAMFQSTKYFLFLSHLSLHHLEIICSIGYNAFRYYSGSAFERTLGIQENRPQRHFGSGILPYSSQLKHSCTPNICRIFAKDVVVYRVIRPIKRGEQLFVSYLDPLQLLLPRSVRAEPLSKRYHFKCDCASCKSNYPPFEATAITGIDEQTCSLLALLEGVPNEYTNKTLVVSLNELKDFEKAAINFLQSNDRVHPTEETFKIQYLLIQIWNLIIG